MTMTFTEREAYLARYNQPRTALEQAECERRLAGYDLQAARCNKRWAADMAKSIALSLKQAKAAIDVTTEKWRECLDRKAAADCLVKKLKRTLRATT